jgi:hypothetical protein
MRAFLTPTSVMAYGLLVWGAVTLLWSPGREAGLEALQGQLPYFVVILLLGPLLVPRVDVLVSSISATLMITTALCTIVLVNPEFLVKDGRLGLDLGAGVRSNPLALGELGGLAILLGALVRRSQLGALALPIRVGAVLVGAAVAIQSGSRGQFFYAILVAVPFLPLAAPVKSARNLILAFISVLFMAFAASFLMDTLLSGFAAKRFSSDELIYGSSSSSTRVENVLALGQAWVQSPVAWVLGLGFYAFNGLFSDAGNIYSHVLFADVIFELGLPGVALMSGFLYFVIRDAFRLFNFASSAPLTRAACAVLIALFAYQLLLVNKQGNLWGSMYFFLTGIIISRLVATLDNGADAMNDVAVSGSPASFGRSQRNTTAIASNLGSRLQESIICAPKMPVVCCNDDESEFISGCEFAQWVIRPQTAPRLRSCRAKGLDESRRFLERDDFSS